MAYGAVARHGGSYRRSQRLQKKFKVCVTVTRNIGASRAHQYIADAHACTYGRLGRHRYGEGSGSTPTSAAKKALRAYASKIK